MKRKLVRWLSLPFAMLTFATILTACNTVEGAGEDIQGAGHAIDQAAEDANN